ARIPRRKIKCVAKAWRVVEQDFGAGRKGNAISKNTAQGLTPATVPKWRAMPAFWEPKKVLLFTACGISDSNNASRASAEDLLWTPVGWGRKCLFSWPFATLAPRTVAAKRRSPTSAA